MASVNVIVAGSASGQAPIVQGGTTASVTQQGTQGPTGPVGPSGADGPSGPAGPSGVAGPIGPTGRGLAQVIDVSVSNPGAGNRFYLDGDLTPTVNLYKGFVYKLVKIQLSLKSKFNLKLSLELPSFCSCNCSIRYSCDTCANLLLSSVSKYI